MHQPSQKTVDLGAAQRSVTKKIRTGPNEFTEFTFFKVDFWTGAEIMHNMIKPVARAFKEALRTFDSGLEKGGLKKLLTETAGKAEKMNFEPAALLEGIESISEVMSFDQFRAMSELLLNGALVNGVPLKAEEHFLEKEILWYITTYHALVVNFPLSRLLRTLGIDPSKVSKGSRDQNQGQPDKENDGK